MKFYLYKKISLNIVVLSKPLSLRLVKTNCQSNTKALRKAQKKQLINQKGRKNKLIRNRDKMPLAKIKRKLLKVMIWALGPPSVIKNNTQKSKIISISYCFFILEATLNEIWCGNKISVNINYRFSH